MPNLKEATNKSINLLSELPEKQVAKKRNVTINIKIDQKQHEWLRDTAQQVRNNHAEPLPPGDRVYPNHLINVAIDLLINAKVDWSSVQSIEDIEKQLNLD